MKLNFAMSSEDFLVSLASLAMRVPPETLRPLRPGTVVELFRRNRMS